ncbi:MAG: DUF1858 domain-containing protein [Ardenticatenaceae bacterium]|nr:DUF1858 domain-containing protein [Ardenticatenaceae bacterium]
MEESQLNLEMTVEGILEEWPETAVIFQNYATACIGCDLGAFCTLAEAANEYQINPQVLLQDLQACIQDKK